MHEKKRRSRKYVTANEFGELQSKDLSTDETKLTKTYTELFSFPVIKLGM